MDLPSVYTGPTEVFELQSVLVFDLIRSRSKFFTSMVPFLFVLRPDPCKSLHSLHFKRLEPN